PRVALVESRLTSARDDERVGRLHQHRAGPTKQHGHLPVYPPGHASRAEIALVRIAVHVTNCSRPDASGGRATHAADGTIHTIWRATSEPWTPRARAARARPALRRER